MKKLLTRGMLALALLGAAMPAHAQQLWKWSQTPASNSTADPAINWATGMAPSAVSPSARGMMSAMAKYRDDNAGRLTTGGTTTAYTVNTYSSYAATPQDGTRVTLTMHLTNGAGATLAIDGGTAFPINATTSTAIPAASLVGGSPYEFLFSGNVNVWLVVGTQGTPLVVPVGAVIDYAGSTAPNSNFALCYGQAISRTTYAALFAIVGTSYGTGDGSTTFNLPDLRGRVTAGIDNMGGTLSGRLSSGSAGFGADPTVLGNSGGNQSHTITQSELPNISPSGTISSFTPSGTISTFNPASTINSFTPTGTVNITGGTVGGTSSGAAQAAGGQDIVINHATIGTNFVGNGITLTGSNVTPTFSGNSVTPTFSGNALGNGFGHSLVQPTMVLTKLIRIL